MFSWLIMHIIGTFPMWVWLTIAGLGGAGYLLAGLVFAFLPFLVAYKEAFKVLCVVICLGGTFMCGSDGVTAVWQEQIKETNARIEAAEAKSKDANDKLAQVRQQKTKVRTEYITTVKERIVKDTQIIDSECKVAPEAIKDLNDAAKNPLKKDATK
jgi:hypothetical protein